MGARRKNAKLLRRISALTAKGASQREIIELLHISRDAAYRAQRSLGLTLRRPGIRCPDLTAAQTAEVLALLRSKLSVKKIVAKLGVRSHAVRQIAKRNGIRRSAGGISADEHAKLVDEIRRRTNFARDLAAKFGTSHKYVLRLAHRELGVSHFVPGLVQPLSSHFPLRGTQNGHQ